MGMLPRTGAITLKDKLKATTEMSTYAEHLEDSTDLPFLPFPCLKILSESTAGVRARVDQALTHQETTRLARTVFGHLIGAVLAGGTIAQIFEMIAQRRIAKVALESKLGPNNLVTPALIADFLQNHTPTIIIKDLRPDEGGFAWGVIVKGDAEGADLNELFISRELTDALLNPPPLDIPQVEVPIMRQRQRLLWSMSLFHETIHSLTKHFFSPNIITPLIGYLVSDGKGNGEPGHTFEARYFGFNLQATWIHADLAKADRMWRISSLVVAEQTTPKVLDDINVDRILRSFGTSLVWRPRFAELAPYPHNDKTHTRYRGGSADALEDEEWQPEDTMTGMVFSRTCMRQAPSGVGLGAGLST